MIRKAVLLTLIFYIFSWLIGAHLIKNAAVKIVEDFSNDNIKLSYSKVEVRGFPFFWKVDFYNPIITAIDHDGLGELSIKLLTLQHNIYNSKIIFSDEVLFNNSQELQQPIMPIIKFSAQPVIDIFYDQPIFTVNMENIKTHFIGIQTSLNDGQYWRNNELVEILKYFELSINKNKKEHVDCYQINSFATIMMPSKSEIKNTELKLDLDYFIHDEDKYNSNEYDHKFNINKFSLTNEDAQMNIVGKLMLEKNKLPTGKLHISIQNYQEFIEQILPDNFIFPKELIVDYIDNNSVPNANDSQIRQFEISL